MAKDKGFVKSGLLFGLGIYGLTKDGIEKLVHKLESKGHITEGEGKKMIADLGKDIVGYEKKAGGFIEEEVRKAVKKMGLVTQRDLQALERKLSKKGKK